MHMHLTTGNGLAPPANSAVQAAMSNLCDVQVQSGFFDLLMNFSRFRPFSLTCAFVQAINSDGQLTALGHHLAKLPVDPHIGKMLIFGTIFSCIDPILTIAACCSYKMPFASSIDRRAEATEARKRLGGPAPESDLVVAINAYNEWATACGFDGGNDRGAARQGEAVCRKFSLNPTVLLQLRDLRKQFVDLLQSIGFLARRDGLMHEKNANSKKPAIVSAVICAGLYPNIARLQNLNGNDIVLAGQGGETRDLVLHKSSVLYLRSDPLPTGSLLTFHQKMATTRSFVMDATVVPANAVVLFGGKLNVDHVNGLVTLDGWLSLPVPARTAVIIKELRVQLETLLHSMVERPKMDLNKDAQHLVKAVELLLQDAKRSVAEVT